MAQQRYVQVTPQSSGEKVSTLGVQTQVDGVLATVDQQVITLADTHGYPLDAPMCEATGIAILHELMLIRHGISQLIGQPLLPDDTRINQLA